MTATCKYCGKKFKNTFGRAVHQGIKHSDKPKQEVESEDYDVSAAANTRRGESSWNQGETKETDKRVKNIAEKHSEAMKGTEPWNKGLTAEKDDRIPTGKNTGVPKGTEPWNKGKNGKRR